MFNGHNLIVEEATFLNNTAIGTTCSGSTAYQRGSGGAISIPFNLDVRISSSNFFGSNATLSGGALYVEGGSVEIFNSSFSFN